jgi:hypothetical protein
MPLYRLSLSIFQAKYLEKEKEIKYENNPTLVDKVKYIIQKIIFKCFVQFLC